MKSRGSRMMWVVPSRYGIRATYAGHAPGDLRHSYENEQQQPGATVLVVDTGTAITDLSIYAGLLYRKVVPGVVLVKAANMEGAGAVIDHGLVVTNQHVIAGAKIVGVFLKPPKNEELSWLDIHVIV